VNALRRVRLWVGALLVAAWASICVFAFAGFISLGCLGGYAPDCGDAARLPFLLGVAASPLVMIGLPLLASGLRNASERGQVAGTRRWVQACCFGVASAFGLCALTSFGDLGSGTGAEAIVVLSSGGVAASVWAGRRVAG
jgi:hypothetical protein